MKKLICIMIALVLCVATVGIVAYKLGLERGKDEAGQEKIIIDNAADESIGKIDYPLIDVAFNDGNEWVVLITYGIYDEQRTYLLCRDGMELQFDKEYLSVITYPAGRGTTGNGSVAVYKNGEEVKYVEFFNISFGNEVKDKFEKVSSKELDEWIK